MYTTVGLTAPVFYTTVGLVATVGLRPRQSVL
jgi:hypothetical protein